MHHRTQVKFQQNRMKHLAFDVDYEALRQGTRPNIIEGGSIGEMHVRAFEARQSLAAQIEG